MSKEAVEYIEQKNAERAGKLIQLLRTEGLRPENIRSIGGTLAAWVSPFEQQDLVAETVLDPEPGQPSNPAVEWVAFNINDYARVKFTAATLELWQRHALEMRAAFPKLTHLWPLHPPLDAEGFYRSQLWSIMHLVGPERIGGGSVFEDCLLYLELPKAVPLTGPTNEGHGR